MPEKKGESTINRYHRLARDRSLSDQAFMDSLSNGGNMSVDEEFWDEEQRNHIYSQKKKSLKMMRVLKVLYWVIFLS